MYDKVKFYYIFTECLNYILEIYVEEQGINEEFDQILLNSIPLYSICMKSNYIYYSIFQTIRKLPIANIIHQTLSEPRSQKLTLRNMYLDKKEVVNK